MVDENLPDRLSTELTYRGWPSKRARELGLLDLDDDDLLRELASWEDPWVLLTADDKMPSVQRDLIQALRSTIATIDPRVEEGFNIDQYRRDVVHRWAHVIANQDAATVRRYSQKTHRAWTPLR